jgi:hypothetical protein
MGLTHPITSQVASIPKATFSNWKTLSFKMDTGWSKYSGNAIMRTTDKKKIIITTDIDNLFSDEFRKSSILKIRVDDEHCGKTIYQFSMAGSTNAINYVLISPN